MTDPIAITASIPAPSVARGGLLVLVVTLTVSAGTVRRELRSGKAVKSADYALLVTTPGSANVTYKSTTVRPALKPRSLEALQVLGNGSLLYPHVPMRLYHNKRNKPSVRKFTIKFRVGAGATSPLVFRASVWKNAVLLQQTGPVQVETNGAQV